jgi:cytoskeletal protein CcmA (bactofilin family)
MAIFSSPSNDAKRDTWPEQALASTTKSTASSPPPAVVPAPTESVKESLVAADLSVEGKIQGVGHVRIAGRFAGDVNVEGNVVIDAGARVAGGVRAGHVTIAGELEGDITGARRVELLDSSTLIGNVQADVVVMAAGARLRGQLVVGDTAASKPQAAIPAPSLPKVDGS